MKRIVLIGVAALSLAACQTTRSAVARPDAAHLRCADEPRAPAGEVTDEQDANYKLALRGSWQDCHSTVQWLKDWFSKLPN